MSQVLVTGATGFIGRALLSRLQLSHEVFAVARKPPEAEYFPGVRWLAHDLTQPIRTWELPSRINAVIHLAQSKHYRHFPEQADDVFRVNVQSTLGLLEYARVAGAQRFILASSGGVYGTSYERFVETDPVNPLDFYLSSKYAAELLVGNYRPFFQTIVLRFFFVYGPGQLGMLIPTLMKKIRERETIRIDGNPGIRINPIFVDDAVAVFEPALTYSGSELFNVAGDEAVTITELIRLCEATLEVQAKVEHIPKQQGDIVADNARIKQALGVEPRTHLVEGLQAVAMSVDEHVQIGR